MEIKTSNEFDLIAKSLNAFQSESEDIVKDKQGYGYKFSDLGALLAHARPIWTKHDLSVIQYPVKSEKENHIGLITRLMHNNGQFMECTMEMEIERVLSKAGKFNMTLAQAAGSVITYMRRYSLQAIFAITSVDDDGSQGSSNDYQTVHSAFKPKPKFFNQNKVMIARIEKLLEEQNKVEEFKNWIAKYNLKSIHDCDEGMLKKCLHKLEVANNALEQEQMLTYQGDQYEDT